MATKYLHFATGQYCEAMLYDGTWESARRIVEWASDDRVDIGLDPGGREPRALHVGGKVARSGDMIERTGKGHIASVSSEFFADTHYEQPTLPGMEDLHG